LAINDYDSYYVKKEIPLSVEAGKGISLYGGRVKNIYYSLSSR